MTEERLTQLNRFVVETEPDDAPLAHQVSRELLTEVRRLRALLNEGKTLLPFANTADFLLPTLTDWRRRVHQALGEEGEEAHE